jgi:hypothetical protein
MAHHVHRATGLGAWVLINENWYNLARDLGIARKGINAGRTGSRAIFMSACRQSLLLI